jgi:hypothetical protein
LEISISENKRLKTALQKSTTLMRAQEALLEEYEHEPVSDKRYQRANAHRRPRLDIFDSVHDRLLPPPPSSLSLPESLQSLNQLDKAHTSLSVAWSAPTSTISEPVEDISISRLGLNSRENNDRYGHEESYEDVEDKDFNQSTTFNSSTAASIELANESQLVHEIDSTLLSAPIQTTSEFISPTTSFSNTTARSREETTQSPFTQDMMTSGLHSPAVNSLSNISPIPDHSHNTLMVSSVSQNSDQPMSLSVGDSFVLIKEYYDSYFSGRDGSSSFVANESFQDQSDSYSDIK